MSAEENKTVVRRYFKEFHTQGEHGFETGLLIDAWHEVEQLVD